MKYIKTYRVISFTEYGYRKLNLLINPHNCKNDLENGHITMSWQGNLISKDDSTWYGFNIYIHTPRIDTIKQASNALSKLNFHYACNPDPQKIISQLKALNYKQVAEHEGLQQLKLVDEWPEGKTYLIKEINNRYCLAKTTALDEWTARKYFMKKAGEAIANGGHYSEQFLNWINLGNPIECIHDECILNLPKIGENEPQNKLQQAA